VASPAPDLSAGSIWQAVLAVLRPGARWLQRLEPVNRWMCWAVLGRLNRPHLHEGEG
jgi:hypothetical protein